MNENPKFAREENGLATGGATCVLLVILGKYVVDMNLNFRHPWSTVVSNIDFFKSILAGRTSKRES